MADNVAGPPPLSGLRVVDLTTELGMFAPRILAGFGAAVTRVEDPEGDPLRHKPPFAHGPSGQQFSLWWLHMTSGSDVRAISLATPDGRAELDALLEGADIVVESQPGGTLRALGLDYEHIKAGHPRLIWTSVTPYGLTGPRATWSGTDITGLASGGFLSLCGDPDRAPLRVSVEQGYAQAGAAAAAATLVALHARNLTGRGQLVDVSMQECLANCLGNTRLFFEFDGVVSKRAGGARAYGEHGARLVYPCKDGFVAMSRTPDMMAPLHRWLSEGGADPGFDPDEWARLPQSGRGTPAPEKTQELTDALNAFFLTRGKMDLYEDGQRHGIMICPVSTPADLLANEQLKARGYFRERHFEDLGRRLVVPGAPVKMSSSPWRDGPASPPDSAAPAVPAAPPPRAAPAVGRDILAGVHVADFSWVGVGPLSTQLLAAMGADVIRVESTARLDVFRGSGPKRGMDPDASAYFANCNKDKRGITLNLKRPEAREVALRLIAAADIVVESFTPGFMVSAGLSYDDIRAVNPGAIMMSCSMEGAWGPHAAFRGFGLTLQGTVGFTHFTSWPDRDPVGTGTAYTDWFATHMAATAVLSALEHRRKTGEGQYIDLSQLETCIWALEAEVLNFTANGRLRPAMGNRHATMAPHGVFPCAGADQWIAIAIRDDRDWRSLVELTGREDWRADRFSTLPARKAAEEELEVTLADWTRSREKHALAELLQSHGIPAYVVADMEDVEHDVQLRSRKHFWTVEHPEIGAADWDGPAFRLSDTPLAPGRAAPLLGQHNSEVYRDILGYSDDEIAELAAAGVIE